MPTLTEEYLYALVPQIEEGKFGVFRGSNGTIHIDQAHWIGSLMLNDASQWKDNAGVTYRSLSDAVAALEVHLQ